MLLLFCSVLEAGGDTLVFVCCLMLLYLRVFRHFEISGHFEICLKGFFELLTKTSKPVRFASKFRFEKRVVITQVSASAL